MKLKVLKEDPFSPESFKKKKKEDSFKHRKLFNSISSTPPMRPLNNIVIRMVTKDTRKRQ